MEGSFELLLVAMDVINDGDFVDLCRCVMNNDLMSSVLSTILIKKVSHLSGKSQHLTVFIRHCVLNRF